MIYIVEDDAAIRELEQYALQSSGYQVNSFPSSEAQIEVAQDSFDTHAYLNELRHGNDTKESEEFHRRLDRYRERYLFPENQSAEDFDK